MLARILHRYNTDYLLSCLFVSLFIEGIRIMETEQTQTLQLENGTSESQGHVVSFLSPNLKACEL